MVTLEDKKGLSAESTFVEKILYHAANVSLLAVFIGAGILFSKWMDSYHREILDLVLILLALIVEVLCWAGVMFYLKISNLIRHLYNRIDDIALRAGCDSIEEE